MTRIEGNGRAANHSNATAPADLMDASIAVEDSNSMLSRSQLLFAEEA
jgi:hypothetical protein